MPVCRASRGGAQAAGKAGQAPELKPPVGRSAWAAPAECDGRKLLQGKACAKQRLLLLLPLLQRRCLRRGKGGDGWRRSSG